MTQLLASKNPIRFCAFTSVLAVVLAFVAALLAIAPRAWAQTSDAFDAANAAKNTGAKAPAAKSVGKSTAQAASKSARPANPVATRAAPAATKPTPPASPTSTPPQSSGGHLSAPASAPPPSAPDMSHPDDATGATEVEHAQPPAQRAEKSNEGYGKTEGILGPVTFGPSVGVGFLPHPIKLGGDIKYRDLIGVQISKGFLPTLKISNTQVGVSGFDVRLRWHPFRGSFLLGMAMGSYEVTGSYTSNFGTAYSGTAKGTIKANYFTPHLGWRWAWKSGFFLGMDFGYQLTKNPQTASTLETSAPAAIQTQIQNSAEYINQKKEIDSKLADYGSKNIPTFTLVQLGWMF